MKTSRDLMLLASVAFKNGKYEDAASLFAASLSSDDSDAFLQHLNKLDDPQAEPLDIESVSSSSTPSLSEIVASIANALSDHQTATAAEEDEDDEESNDADEADDGDIDAIEDEEDEDDDESEDEGDDESISTSSVAKTSGVKRLPKGDTSLVLKVNSPIKLKS